jgi:hypothetical protein
VPINIKLSTLAYASWELWNKDLFLCTLAPIMELMFIVTTEGSHTIKPIKLSDTLIPSSAITVCGLKVRRFTPAFSHIKLS